MDEEVSSEDLSPSPQKLGRTPMQEPLKVRYIDSLLNFDPAIFQQPKSSGKNFNTITSKENDRELSPDTYADSSLYESVKAMTSRNFTGKSKRSPN